MEISCTDRATWKQRRAWSRTRYLSLLISCASGQETRTRAHVPCVKSVPRVSRHRAPRAARALSSCNPRRLRSYWMPLSLRQNPAVSAAILVFQKYGLPGRCGAAGRAKQGGLNDIVGFQFCELIIAAFSQPPGARYNILHNLLYG